LASTTVPDPLSNKQLRDTTFSIQILEEKVDEGSLGVRTSAAYEEGDDTLMSDHPHEMMLQVGGGGPS
jgi:hypothetical protein